jgi:hypothetical protein
MQSEKTQKNTIAMNLSLQGQRLSPWNKTNCLDYLTMPLELEIR